MYLCEVMYVCMYVCMCVCVCLGGMRVCACISVYVCLFVSVVAYV